MKYYKIIIIIILILLITGISIALTTLKPINKGPDGIQKCITHYSNGFTCIDMDIVIAEYMIKYPSEFDILMRRLNVCKNEKKQK